SAQSGVAATGRRGNSAGLLERERIPWRRLTAAQRPPAPVPAMLNPAHQKGPFTPGERHFVVLFATLVLWLFVAEIVRYYQPVKLTTLLFLLIWIPLLALHEAGHAVMAALLGWYVGRVVIGVGRLLATFRVGTAVVEVRLLPLEGFVQPVPRNLRSPRL